MIYRAMVTLAVPARAIVMSKVKVWVKVRVRCSVVFEEL